MVQGSSSQAASRQRALVVGGIVASAALIGMGAWMLAPRAVSVSQGTGPRLSIAVVPPVEPVITPGGILEVGSLNDGFDRAILDRHDEMADVDYVPQDAYVGDDWAPPEPVAQPTTYRSAAVSVATVTTTDPLADGSRHFGFDRRQSVVGEDEVSGSLAIQSDSMKNTDTFFE